MWEYANKIGKALKNYWKEVTISVAVPVLVCGCTKLAEGWWEGYENHHRRSTIVDTGISDYDLKLGLWKLRMAEKDLERLEEEQRRATWRINNHTRRMMIEGKLRRQIDEFNKKYGN